LQHKVQVTFFEPRFSPISIAATEIQKVYRVSELESRERNRGRNGQTNLIQVGLSLARTQDSQVKSLGEIADQPRQRSTEIITASRNTKKSCKQNCSLVFLIRHTVVVLRRRK